MTTVNVHDAKTHFSQLLDRVAQGESITIAKAGRPVAELVPLKAVPVEQRRLGFLRGHVRTPDDFDTMGNDEIAATFAGDR